MQKLLFFNWLWLRRFFGLFLVILFIRCYWLHFVILLFNFLKVGQIDRFRIAFLRVWTDVILEAGIRISYLSVDSLAILENHGDINLLVIG